MHRRRAVSAAVVGNVLEWYDLAVFAFVASTMGEKFFPLADRSTALLAAFLTYGIGFVARPAGAIVLGRLGDRRGRRTALLVTVFLMAGGTVAIGLLPTYASVGLLAPVLLVVARLTQGFSAGGDWGTSTAFIVEWAPDRRRGWYGSFQQASVAAGLLLGSGVAALLNSLVSPAEMEAWGWRVPFLLGAMLGPVGMYMRRAMEETPRYEAAAATPATAMPAARAAMLAARAFGFTIVWTVSYYILLNYMPSWAEQYLHVGASQALWSNTIGLLLLLVLIPCMGWLSDRWGRKPLLLSCCVALVVLPYPLLSWLIGARPSFGALIAVQAIFALLISMFSGPGPAAIAEIFPTRQRSTWMTTGYAFAVTVFGGFAPFISVWLIRRFASPTVHTVYMGAAAVVSTVVIATMPETAFDELR